VGLVPVCWILSGLVYLAVVTATQGECYEAATDAGLAWARGLLALTAVVILGLWMAAGGSLETGTPRGSPRRARSTPGTGSSSAARSATTC
jgi:hypothetical protein